LSLYVRTAMQILEIETNNVLFDFPTEETRRLVELAAEQRQPLVNASLRYCFMGNANLKGVNLAGADLRDAQLNSTTLQYADLYNANLEDASLCFSILVGANLVGANLKGTKLPSPTMVLLADWGELSDELTADLMVWDSVNHPNPNAFDVWAKTGACPYVQYREVSRAANFHEKPSLWGKGKECKPYDLMKRVLAEKCPPWTDEQLAKFSK